MGLALLIIGVILVFLGSRDALRSSLSHPRYILTVMTTSPARRRHLANSPFQPDPEPIIEQFEFGDMVNHDSYGVGRVIGTEAAAVTVDFRTQTVRITSPFHKMAIL